MSYQISPWSLTELFPALESTEYENAFKQVENCVAEFEKFRSDLVPEITPSHFLMILREAEEITRVISRIYSFAGLAFTADTQNQTALVLQGRVQQVGAELHNRMLFFDLWWKTLDDENAKRLLDAVGDYRYYLESMRLFKDHTLSEAEEKIINIKNVTGVEALSNLYDSITNQYVFKMEVDGVAREMTRGELMTFARHPNPDLRAAAYRELYRVFGENGTILGQIYQTRVRDWRNENVSLRKYASPLAARNLANDIPDDVVETILELANKNASIFQRFFKVKARLLGVERLRRCDVYAPVSESKKTYAFDEAVNMVLESFNQFDPKFATLAKRVFDDQHLDSEVRKGKRDGAFCWTVGPDLTPWVLVNYQGQADDAATLAHELGHAIHSMMAEHHSIFSQQASLPLAETASTFGEMMLIDKLLAQESDPAVQRDILFRQMDDAYATILRQSYFAMFEKQAHSMIQNNASIDELNAAYMENLKAQFGDAIELSDEFQWEWVSIPHIYHTPFYVYAYAFGQLLVFSLYQQFKIEGDSFKPRYIKILEMGGAESPEKILQKAGIDFHSPAFWQGGFDVLAGLVDKLEKMA